MSKKYNFYADGGSTGLPAGAEQQFVNYYLNEGASVGVFADGGGVGEWKKGVTIKIDTRKRAEKDKKLLQEYWGKSGRNFKVEKRDDKYVITYEFKLSDKMEQGGSLVDGYLTDPNFGDFQAGIYDNGGQIDTKNVTIAKRIKVKKWYLKTYPKDDLGKEIREDITFWSLWALMSQGYDVYNILGVGDSMIRERVFEELSKILGVDYDVVYQKWLNSDEYAGGGEIEFQHSNLRIVGTGIDKNGNRVVKVSFPNQRPFSIQTNGNLPKTHSLLKDYDKKNTNFYKGEIESMEDEILDYIEKYGSENQKKSVRVYGSWLNKDDYAEGGSLGNHGLKQGDQIIKTMSGGIQKIKTRSGDIVYVNLANGYRGAEPPLPFDNGGMTSNSNEYIYAGQLLRRAVMKEDLTPEEANSPLAFDIALEEAEDWADAEEMGTSDFGYMYRNFLQTYKEVKEKSDYFKNGGAVKKNLIRDRKFVNYSQDYEVRYSKDKPKRHGYTKPKMSRTQFEDESFEFFADGGEIRRFNRHEQMDSETREEILDVVSEPNTPRGLVNYLYGLFDGYDYSNTANFKKEMKVLKSKDSKLHDRVIQIYKKIDNYKFEKYGNYATGGGVGNGYVKSYYNESISGGDNGYQVNLMFYKNLDDEDYFDEEYITTSSPKKAEELSEKINKLGYEGFLPMNKYANGGVTKNYINRSQLNTITIKKGDQKLTYKVSDVYNGAYKLEDGGNLEKMAFYVSKRNVVKVQLKNGKDVKVANGYWIKKGAKPIHTSKYDDGGRVDKYEDWEMIVVSKELNKDGGRYIKDRFLVSAKNIEQAKEIATNLWYDMYGKGTDLSIVKVMSESLYELRYFDKYDDGGQLEMKFAGGGKIETKIQKKVDEVNALIKKAIDSDGDPLMVVDTTGTWEEPMQYKPIIYKNGRLYIEYYEPYSGKTEKDVINKSNIDFDGYPTLLNIAKMYRKALKKEGISYAGGGAFEHGISKEDLENYKIQEVLKEIVDIDYDYDKKEKSKFIILAKPIQNNYKDQRYEPKVFIITNKSIYSISNVSSKKWEEIKKDSFDNNLTYERYGYFKLMLTGGKTTFKEKATAIAKNFEGKKVEPKYQKEYGKVYDKAEAKEVGNKIAGSQKAKYDSKMSGGGSTTKRGGAMVLAKQIRKDGESWGNALKRANEQMRKK